MKPEELEELEKLADRLERFGKNIDACADAIALSGVLNLNRSSGDEKLGWLITAYNDEFNRLRELTPSGQAFKISRELNALKKIISKLVGISKMRLGFDGSQAASEIRCRLEILRNECERKCARNAHAEEKSEYLEGDPEVKKYHELLAKNKNQKITKMDLCRQITGETKGDCPKAINLSHRYRSALQRGAI